MHKKISIGLLVAIFMFSHSHQSVATTPRERVRETTPERVLTPTPASPQAIQTKSLASGLTLEEIIAALVGTSSIAISNVKFSGSDSALGTFSGGTGIIGFEGGIVLSTGRVEDVIGPNSDNSTTWEHGRPGDPDLDRLVPNLETFDACVLEFDFECPGVREIGFEYVFSSEEYNEFVNEDFNDVFGFFVNGQNIALLPDGQTIVSINTVNNGNPPGVGASNPQFYRDNDHCNSGRGDCPYDTEMDGLTVVLIARAAIAPGINHIKLVVGDVSDYSYDSNVFLKGQSFVCGAVNNTPPVCTINPAGPFSVYVGEAVNFEVKGTDIDDGQSIYLYSLGNLPPGATMIPSLPVAGSRTGLSSQFSWTPSQPGVFTAGFFVTDSLGGVDTATAEITVSTPPVNNPPVCTIDPPGPFSLNVGSTVNFTVTGTDPDDGQSIYLYALGNLPPGATMTPSLPRAGSRTGLSSQFSWTPSQPGTYFASFFVTDSVGGADSATAQITVTSPQVNNRPLCTIIPPGPFTINAGKPFTFTVNGTDPDVGQVIHLTHFGSLPSGATMNPALPLSGPHTGISSQFSWTPTQLGNFFVGFLLNDSLGGLDTASALITVLEGVPPRVLSTTPANGAIEVIWDARVLIQFSERINANQVQTSIQAISSRHGSMAINIALLNDSLVAITPQQHPWPDDGQVSIRILGSLADRAGNTLDGNANGVSEGVPADNYAFSFLTAPGVYRGDANDDGIVDERDILPLGVHYLRTGPPRSHDDKNWELEFAQPWTPREATHADCDGNGIIDSNDVCAILEFFDREIPAKRALLEMDYSSLQSVHPDIRASLARALINCGIGSPAARARLLEALSSPTNADAPLPASFRLDQNYPNPFNAGTTIRFVTEDAGTVELVIFDLLGRSIRRLINHELPSGSHSVDWDGTDDEGRESASGVYLYRLTLDSHSLTRRMVLIR